MNKTESAHLSVTMTGSSIKKGGINMIQKLTESQVWDQWHGKRDFQDHSVEENAGKFYVHDDKSGLDLYFEQNFLMLHPGKPLYPLWKQQLTLGESANLLAIANQPAPLYYRLGYFRMMNGRPSFLALPFDEEIQQEPDVLIEVDWGVTSGVEEVTKLELLETKAELDLIYAQIYTEDAYRDEGTSYFVLRNATELAHPGINHLVTKRQEHVYELRRVSNLNFQAFAAHRAEYQEKFHELLESRRSRSFQVDFDDEEGCVRLRVECSPGYFLTPTYYYEALRYEVCRAWLESKDN